MRGFPHLPVKRKIYIVLENNLIMDLDNPEILEKITKKRAYRSNSLSIEEQEKFLASLEEIEDIALFQLELTTGIRREDIAKIDIKSIDLENRKLVFWEQKKKRVWEVPLSMKTVQVLKIYLNTKPKNAKKLFDFTGRTAYNKLQKGLKKAGINKILSFHDLRRSFIKNAKKQGLSVKAVSQIVGDTVATVQEHYENYDLEELKSEIEKLEKKQ